MVILEGSLCPARKARQYYDLTAWLLRGYLAQREPERLSPSERECIRVDRKNDEIKDKRLEIDHE